MLPRLSIALLISALLLPALAFHLPRQDSAESATDVDALSRPKPGQGTMVVDDIGTKLFYIDSGAPRSSTYTTIFAIHGLTFTGEIFRRIMDLAPAANLRIVAVNRRCYPGSTPYNATENDILLNGSDVQKQAFLDAQGMQLLTFIDKFTVDNQLPITTPARTGGIALMGWSLGNSLTLAAVANADKLPTDARNRLASRLRSVIMLEPPSVALGVSYPPQTWSPMQDTSIPPETQVPYFVQWITSYFKHGDITKRDTSLISFVVPDPSRTPSIFGMTSSEMSKVVYEDSVNLGEGLYLFFLGPQFLANYQKACYDKAIRSLLGRMQIWMVTGDATASFSIASLWSIEDDELARGSRGSFIKYKILNGANHFVHWDEPDNTIKYIQSML